jgi:hypothetical protein
VQNIRLRSFTNIQVSFDSDSVVPSLKSDKRGYVALVYSGTARSFSANFESHIINIMAGCPYTVHLFFYTYINDNRYSENMINSYVSYMSINATLEYFEGYINLDNERILFRDAVKANVFEYMPLETLRRMYSNTYDISEKRFPDYPPISGIYYMWHSQRRSEELRQKYMADTGIDYKWTFRMRHDAVYFTNWWQMAFNVIVYNPFSLVHTSLSPDVSTDWGIRRTRLYDMVYEPKLKMNDAIYVPFGWSWGGYNDQFAAMPSMHANRYFMRILHIDRMIREAKVHPETSIRLVARWNNMTVNNVDGTICYSIVRVLYDNKQHVDNENERNQPCRYSESGEEDCNILCPKLIKINEILRESLIHDLIFPVRNIARNAKQVKSLLMQHLSRINNGEDQIYDNASSFYYFYRYVTPKYVNDPCLSNTWSKEQSNNDAMQNLPFVLRTLDRKKISTYNRHLTCVLFIEISPYSEKKMVSDETEEDFEI